MQLVGWFAGCKKQQICQVTAAAAATATAFFIQTSNQRCMPSYYYIQYAIIRHEKSVVIELATGSCLAKLANLIWRVSNRDSEIFFPPSLRNSCCRGGKP